jgi:hypothetical protein
MLGNSWVAAQLRAQLHEVVYCVVMSEHCYFRNIIVFCNMCIKPGIIVFLDFVHRPVFWIIPTPLHRLQIHWTDQWLRLALSNEPHSVDVSHPVTWGRKQVSFRNVEFFRMPDDERSLQIQQFRVCLKCEMHFRFSYIKVWRTRISSVEHYECMCKLFENMFVFFSLTRELENILRPLTQIPIWPM